MQFANSLTATGTHVPYGITQCYLPPSRGDIPVFTPASTRFSDPGGMQGWLDLVGLVTYRGGIPARRRSPIPVLTGLNLEQLRSCDERRYCYSKPANSGNDPSTFDRILVSFSLVTLEITVSKKVTFGMIWRKLACLTNYLRMCLTDVHQSFELIDV